MKITDFINTKFFFTIFKDSLLIAPYNVALDIFMLKVKIKLKHYLITINWLTKECIYQFNLYFLI